MAVGCLRGYALNATIAARVAPSYTYTFSGHHQAELLRKDSPYCTTGEQAGRAGAHMVAPEQQYHRPASTAPSGTPTFSGWRCVTYSRRCWHSSQVLMACLASAGECSLDCRTARAAVLTLYTHIVRSAATAADLQGLPLCTPTSGSALCACRYESFIFIAPPAIAPLLGAVYVRRFGRRSGIMLGCVIIIIGQVRRHQDLLCCAVS